MYTDPYVQVMRPPYLRAFNVQVLKTGQSYRPTQVCKSASGTWNPDSAEAAKSPVTCEHVWNVIQCDLTERSASHREARVQCQGCPYEICRRQSDTGVVSFPVRRFSPKSRLTPPGLRVQVSSGGWTVGPLATTVPVSHSHAKRRKQYI